MDPRRALSVVHRDQDLDIAPHVSRGFDDEAQLRRLRFDRDGISVDGARKAALRRQAHLLERRAPPGFRYAPLQVVLGLEPIELGADQAKNDALAFRYVTQRREIARSRIVVFEE